MKPELGSVVGGKYRLERALAAGGMGSVWVARDVRLEIEVAVKFMAADLAEAPTAATRFEREAKAAAQLKSPHVVHIYDYGLEDGSPYIAMELLSGEDLADVLDRERRLPLARAAEIVHQAAKALRAAHEAHIVHRDIKPANLFLARSGDDTVVKVLDFGIAKETQLAPDRRGPTTTGAILGSPLYMSPEQARGGTITERSDLWSLGVVAFEMVTGCQPFLGASVGDVIAKICGDELPVASRFAPDLPPEVDTFFARALARDPAARFASARDFAEAFSALADAQGTAHADRRASAISTQGTGPGRLDETRPLPASPRFDDTLPALETQRRGAAAPPPESSLREPSAAATGITQRDDAPAEPRSRARFVLPAGVALTSLLIVAFFALRSPPGEVLPGKAPPAPASVSTAGAPSPSPSSPPALTAPEPTVLPAPPLPASSEAVAPSARPLPSAAPPRPALPAPSARPSARPNVDPIFGLPAPK